MTERYRMFAAYNAWANERIYGAAAQLSDADYRASRGAFFGSLHGTLNHLLVGDRIWMYRFTGSGDAPTRLDAILFENFDDLREARRAEDQRITRYCDSLDEAKLAGEFSYRTISNPKTVRQPLGRRSRRRRSRRRPPPPPWRRRPPRRRRRASRGFRGARCRARGPRARP
jgi:uncharacterized damage-inducible protein DinB